MAFCRAFRGWFRRGCPSASELTGLRRFLAVIFLLGTAGLAAELLLVGHFEDPWQLVPLVLIAAGIVMLVWNAARPNGWSLRLFRATALLQIAGGLLGLGLHYQSNVEFELEMYADLKGFQLVREALTGAIPALAPGALIQLGLIGLACTYDLSTTARTAPGGVERQEKP